MPVCRMCGTESILCKAHIIPDALKRSIWDGVQNFHAQIDVSRIKTKHQQTLRFDKDILCSACDNMLGRYDDTLVKFIRDFFDFSRDKKESDIYIEIGTNTKNLELGIVACVWRMSISNSEMYNNVNLGNYYEKELRNWLITGEPTQKLRRKFTIFLHCCIPSMKNITCAIVPHPFITHRKFIRYLAFYASGVNITCCMGEHGRYDIFRSIHRLHEQGDSSVKMYIADKEGTLLNSFGPLLQLAVD